MMPDASAVYIADTLPSRYPALTHDLLHTLSAVLTPVQIINNTRDIWLRDFMPVPAPSGRLIQFRYEPDYLRGPRWQHLVTDTTAVCHALSMAVQTSNIVVDGGNIVRGPRAILMTDKVLRENPRISPAHLQAEMAELLGIDRLILLPTDPHDFVGHADGMVYFLDERTVLVNDYTQERTGFWKQLRAALRNAQLDWVPLPYNPYRNTTSTDAAGIYINFLCTEAQLLVPIFEQKEDEIVLKQLQQLFPQHQIQPIQCRELAREGGLLHCITWTATM